MIDDSKQCEPCPWPLDCCTEQGAPIAKPVKADCPKEHGVWDRLLSDRLALPAASPIAALPEAEEDLLLV